MHVTELQKLYTAIANPITVPSTFKKEQSIMLVNVLCLYITEPLVRSEGAHCFTSAGAEG